MHRQGKVAAVAVHDESTRDAAEVGAALLALAHERGRAKTFCPSEAARRVAPEDWRARMPAVRAKAAELVEAGRLQMLQRRRVVDPTSARGAVRLRIASDEHDEPGR